MADKKHKTPLGILQDIEQRSRSMAFGLPQQAELKTEWIGIGFRLGGQRMVVPLDEVTEILTSFDMSRVPGSKTWVLGIANVRGNLLPIMDLAGYLRGEHSQVRKVSRVLVVDHEDINAGLLVDEVLGLRHFPEDSKLPGMIDTDISVSPYLDCAYRIDKEEWPVFSMFKLARSPLFMQVAV